MDGYELDNSLMSNYIKVMKNNGLLELEDYREEIELFQPFLVESEKVDKEVAVEKLLHKLHNIPDGESSYNDKRRLLRAVLNTLKPNTLNSQELDLIDNLLQMEIKEKCITDVDDLEVKKIVNGTKLSVWLGDVTSLKSDVIVNAANNQLLGCFSPLHLCIDNAIHSGAGPRLRDDCKIIMSKQGFLEPTGQAKITRAYNLPSSFVIHTVGPIVEGCITEKSRRDLESAYLNCLELCKKIKNIRSITFCSISTGVFGYPIKEASKVAITTVTEWLEGNPGKLDRVVFNLFSEEDYNYYDIK